MGDTANWLLEVSIDVHSVQFVEDGHYVLVLTFHDDQLTGSRDLKVSRDGVTFKDGQSLRSDVVKQEQPEETVEIQNNLFVFRLPKGMFVLIRLPSKAEAQMTSGQGSHWLMESPTFLIYV